MMVVVVVVSSQSGRALLEGEDLLLQRGELQDAQRVVLGQEAAQSVPAAADPHHHVFPMKHSNKDGLVPESVAALGQVLDGDPVGAVTGRLVHPSLLGLVEAAVLAAHTEGFDGGRRLFGQKQGLLLQLDLLLQLHQDRRLHPIL